MIENTTPEESEKLQAAIRKYALNRLKTVCGLDKQKPKEETKEHQEESKELDKSSYAQVYPSITKTPASMPYKAPVQTQTTGQVQEQPATGACCTIQ